MSVVKTFFFILAITLLSLFSYCVYDEKLNKHFVLLFSKQSIIKICVPCQQNGKKAKIQRKLIVKTVKINSPSAVAFVSIA